MRNGNFLIYNSRMLLFYLFDTLGILMSKFKRKTGLGHIKIIVLIKMDAIGDFIIWLDAAKKYKEIYSRPNYSLTLMCSDLLAPVARMMPYWDNVVSINKNDFTKICNIKKLIGYRFTKISSLHANVVEGVIHPTHSREFETGDALVRAINAHWKVGSLGDTNLTTKFIKTLGDRFYTNLIEISDNNRLELAKNVKFLNEMTASEEEWSIPELKLDQVKISFKTPNSYFVLFPGASATYRCWPRKCFAEICRHIYNKYKFVCVICGSSDETDIAEDIVNQSGDIEVINLVGKTELLDVFKIVERAKFLIGNETSGPLIAMAMHTPSVCILGGGDFGRFAPIPNDMGLRHVPKCVYNIMECYKCNWECKFGATLNGCFPCIENVTVEEVWGAVVELMAYSWDQ